MRLARWDVSRNQSVKERVLVLEIPAISYQMRNECCKRDVRATKDAKGYLLLNYQNLIRLGCRSRVKQIWNEVVITDTHICQNRGNVGLAHLMGRSSWNAGIARRDAKVTEHTRLGRFRD